MSGKFKFKGLDYPLLIATLLLLAVGVVMIYSASSYTALELFSDRNKFLEQTLRWVGIGVIGMFAVSLIPYRLFNKFAFVIMLLSVLSLIYLLLRGETIREVKRWFYFFGFQIQPSEFSKAALILFVSSYLTRFDVNLHPPGKRILHYLVLTGVIGVVALLIFEQPNKSAAAITALIPMTVMFVYGVHTLYFLVFGAAGLFAFWRIALASEYSRRRLVSFLDPFADMSDSGWQVVQSLFALSLGRVWGVGLGNSMQNKLYIPDPQNDFILGPIGEELGMLGTVGLLVLYTVVIYRCIKIAMQAPDRFSALVCSGVAATVFIHVAVNYAVATSVAPATGVTLPLVSYGGSSMIVFMSLLGIVQNIARHRVREGTVVR